MGIIVKDERKDGDFLLFCIAIFFFCIADEMNTIDELLYYCRESEPVGAVLLSGEWGCGKTYLVDHELKAILDGEAVILRISLFGITRPEEIQKSG